MDLDLGLKSLVMMARYHGVAADEAQLRHEFGPRRFTPETILLGAKSLGLKAKLVKQDPDRLDRAPLPAMAIDKEGNFFIAVKLLIPGCGDPGRSRRSSHPNREANLGLAQE